MTRIMGDATHAHVAEMAAAGPWDLVAGYDTGSPDIDWTPADTALFRCPVLMIDQGFTGSPNMSATVRDVEFGAWQPGQAVNITGWNADRPTLYLTTGETGYNLGNALADGWRRDIWVPIPGWQPGQPLPALIEQAIALGCTLAAIQNELDVAGAYDRSIVLDPWWPNRGGHMLILEVDRTTVPAGVAWPGDWLLRCDGTITHIQTVPQLTAYTNAGLQTKTISYTDWQALAGVS